MTRLFSRSVVVALAAAALSVFILACAPEIVEEEFAPSESHQSYTDALRALELAETEMGRRWLTEGEAAVNSAPTVETPFREVLQFLPEEPRAVGYRFQVQRGHQISIDVATELDAFFLDVFRIADRDDSPTLVASRPQAGTSILFEPRKTGEYVLRIQPQLLRGGRMTVEVIADAGLAFPVQDADPGDVRSFYGDPRDGGARIHEGIDIFAPRGTPILAASESYVMRVGTRDRGGNVVVLHDRERDLYLYYAHLEEHRAVEGTVVQAGDVVGTTGNTGNAVTTPPHLHIGIYDGSWRRALDPWDFFVGPGTEPVPVALSTEHLGTWRSVSQDSLLERIVEAPEGTQGDESRINAPVKLPVGTAVQVLGGIGRYARVRTDTGEVGFVSHDALADARSSQVLSAGMELRDVYTGDVVAVVTDVQPSRMIGRISAGALMTLPNGRAVVVDGSEI